MNYVKADSKTVIIKSIQNQFPKALDGEVIE